MQCKQSERSPRPKWPKHQVGALRSASLLLIALIPLVAAGADTTVTVEQRRKSFSSASIALERGQTVRFTNADPFAHQIYIESAAMHYESGIQDPGATQEVTFASGGTFEVRCAIHPRMQMHVEVH